MSPLCDTPVTIYHRQGDTVTKRTEPACFYHYEDRLVPDGQGLGFVRKFLLIQPGENPIYPGDKILAGEGPDVTSDSWDTFLPENTPTLSVVTYASGRYFAGEIRHWEAGGVK